MHGLYLLWWVQEKQMSPAVVAAILSAGDLALMLLELPTGWFADRFGHRVSLAVGSFVQVAGMLWCWLGQGITGLVIASVLVALGDAFRSGADQALLYRTCLVLDREDAFQKIESRTRAAELAALVGLVLAGGVIVRTWGFAAGWAAEAALCLLGLAIACAMTEPPSVADITVEDRAAENHHPLPKRMIARLILPAAFLGAAASAASFLAQTAGTSDPERLTTLVAMITLAEAAGSALAARVAASGTREQAILAACGAMLLVSAPALPPAFPLVVLALAFLVGLAHPLRDTAIQRLAADGVRARAASAASACDMAFSTIALPLVGVWRSRRRVRL
jgi:MFS family permease